MSSWHIKVAYPFLCSHLILLWVSVWLSLVIAFIHLFPPLDSMGTENAATQFTGISPIAWQKTCPSLDSSSDFVFLSISVVIQKLTLETIWDIVVKRRVVWKRLSWLVLRGGSCLSSLPAGHLSSRELDLHQKLHTGPCMRNGTGVMIKSKKRSFLKRHRNGRKQVEHTLLKQCQPETQNKSNQEKLDWGLFNKKKH